MVVFSLAGFRGDLRGIATANELEFDTCVTPFFLLSILSRFLFFFFFLFNRSLKRFPINALKGSRFKEWENCTLRFDIFNLVFRVTNVFIRFSAVPFLALNKFELKQNRLPNFLNNSKICWEYRSLNIVCQQRLYT